MNKKDFGTRLKIYLLKEKDIVKISRWAYSVFCENPHKLDSILSDTLEYLFRMEDDPQFEYTYEELMQIAENLINDEDDPIKEINEKKKMKSNI